MSSARPDAGPEPIPGAPPVRGAALFRHPVSRRVVQLRGRPRRVHGCARHALS